MTTRRKKIYEGKAKILYEGPEPGTLIQYFKDDATAFNAQAPSGEAALTRLTPASSSTMPYCKSSPTTRQPTTSR